MSLKAIISFQFLILTFCISATANSTKVPNHTKETNQLLPMYSLAKEKGHTQIDCTASNKLAATKPSEVEEAQSDISFSCQRNERNILPLCKITKVNKLNLDKSNQEVVDGIVETTLSRGFLFYFSKNRVEALAKSVKTADGWATTPKNKRNIVQINNSMTELKMPEINVTGSLEAIDGFLFVKEITSTDKNGKGTTTTEYAKSGDVFYPTSIHAKATFKETSHLDVFLSISNCTSK